MWLRCKAIRHVKLDREGALRIGFVHQFEGAVMHIAASWETLMSTAASPDDDTAVAPAELARWAAVEASFADRPVTELAQAWVEEELRVVEAAEAVKAWADAR